MIKRLLFNYRLSIALLLVLTILVVPAGLGFAALNVTGTPNSTSIGSNQITSFDDSKFVETNLPSNVVSNMESTVKNFITNQAELRHFEINSLQIEISGEKQNANEVEVAFTTQYKHKLNIAKPEDAPVIKGQIKYLNANNKEMSEQSIQIAKDRIAHWKSTIGSYMNTYTPLNGFFKATAQIDSNNNIVPDTLKLYAEDPFGHYLPADSIYQVPSDNEVEQQSYDGIKMDLEYYSNMAAKSAVSGQAKKAVSASYSYNNGAALNYAVAYTSNPSTTCYDGGTLQNTSYYNSAYNWYACNDCANYVSQAMKAGGIPTDGSWYPYSSAWINVPSMESYMVNHSIWHSSSWATVPSGGVVEFTSGGTGYHVVMVIYNDGSTFEYSGHTSDRNYCVFYGGSGVKYWSVY